MADLATTQDVSRLFARAAFGATPADLDRWTGREYAAVVEHLLDIPDPTVRVPLADEPKRLFYEQARYNNLPVRVQFNAAAAQRWWLERMRTTPYPLEERMTLFWHDHFATALGELYPDIGMMMQQNQLLRRNALGNFRTMVAEITLDPAMLYWLNGNENTGNNPNENYAREFFELFTLGKYPRIYTDSDQSDRNDIHEAARVFTGWIVDPQTRRITFSAGRHDTRTKVVLGKSITNKGNVEYLDLVDLALAQTVSPYFVAYKLVSNFGYLPVGADPSQPLDLLTNTDPLVTKVGEALRKGNWQIKDGVRAMLLAPEFRNSDPAKEQRIVRQPIDLVVSAAKAIGISVDSQEAIEVLDDMGQVPFQPPTVGGWPRGRDWISPVTTLARYDWGVALYNLWAAITPALRPFLPIPADMDAWAKRFGLAALSASTRALITDYIAKRSAAGATNDELTAGVMILIASSPDWMVV